MKKIEVARIIAIPFAMTILWSIFSCSKETAPVDTENRPPQVPTIVGPQHQSTIRNISPVLSWNDSDPDGDPLTYSVYFGTLNPPLLVSSGQTATSYSPPALAYGAKYYWRIVAKDNHNDSTSSPTWEFTTFGQAPQLELSTSALDFAGNYDTLLFTMENGGADPLTWHVATDRQWITAGPSSGTTTDETDSIVVAVNRSLATRSLGWDAYTGSVVITWNGGIDSVHVSMTKEDSHSGSWSALGAGISSWVFCLAQYDNMLIAGGWFSIAGGDSASAIAAWNGTSWMALGSGMTLGARVSALAVYNNSLIAGGEFDRAGGVAAMNIAAWNGSSWSPLGSGIGQSGSFVSDLAVYDGRLIACGRFSEAGGHPAICIASWNGTGWSSLSSGLGSQFDNVCANALGVFGDKLIVAGQFTSAGGTNAMNIAAWNGSTWSPLSSGIGSGPIMSVGALSVYGDLLAAGGAFTVAGGSPALNAAIWNGTSWSPLTVGTPLTGCSVGALAVYKGRLIVGGDFSEAGGSLAANIAAWDGTEWKTLGSGTNSAVMALTLYNNSLIAAGYFTTAGGVAANGIAAWTE